jgi:hypothetical protein
MGSVFGKGGKDYVSGYRYFFSVLAGICRGPVDEIYLIKSDGKVFWDGTNIRPGTFLPGQANATDPVRPPDTDTVASAGYPGGPMTDNTETIIWQPQLYGGDKGEGGIDGMMWLYMGAKDQIVAAGDYIHEVMAPMLLSAFRGVVTVFYDGQVTANNPYPKAWNYRVRRALKGWDGPVWYPEAAIIALTDPAIPTYSGGVDYAFTSTNFYSGNTELEGGESTGSSQVATSSWSNGQRTVSTYTATGGTTSQVVVPLQYNQIKAMNPAHIIYECVTNRDWGRGLDRALVDHVSFADAANILYGEHFGLCIKWSRTEDVDAFIQIVLDHIGGAVYTNRVSGLLCLRLLRGGYDVSSLSVFDYNSGLIEIGNIETAAQGVTANEVVVRYHSPVIDADKEARQQNIAVIDQLGCVFSVSVQYPGIPTSDLALRVAQRDLKIASAGWKKVEFKLDRRAYRLHPGDVIVLNAPDRGLANMIVRVATVEDSVMTDGTISVVGSQDIYGLPLASALFQQPQGAEYFEPNRLPGLVQNYYANDTTWRDQKKARGDETPDYYDHTLFNGPGYMIYVAAPPTASSLNFSIQTWSAPGSSAIIPPFETTGTSRFCLLSKLDKDIGVYDTVFTITGRIQPSTVAVGRCLLITRFIGNHEFMRIDAISRNPTTGKVTLTVARGCIDTPAIPHKAGDQVWDYDGASIDAEEFPYGYLVAIRALVHTSLGDGAPNGAYYTSVFGRAARPYHGADFRLNGYPRDATPNLTGDLTFTWKHRNRITQSDQLVGELESEVAPEPNTYYGVFLMRETGPGNWFISGVDNIYGAPSVSFRIGHTGTASNTITIPADVLARTGWTGNTLTALLQTYRFNPTESGIQGIPISDFGNEPRIVFYYGAADVVPSDAEGFNYEFDLNFGS